jgi:hypothetical protein
MVFLSIFNKPIFSNDIHLIKILLSDLDGGIQAQTVMVQLGL